MAKMTKTIRRNVFERALLKLYGERFAEEEHAFKAGMETVLKNQSMRGAKERGIDYETLITNYEPYVRVSDCLCFRTERCNYFSDELNELFYNEHKNVLFFEDSRLPILRQYRNGEYRGFTTVRSYPITGFEFCTEDEHREIASIYKRYGDFMNEVIVSARSIRDVINSTSTTNQLEEMLPELGDFIPAQKNCTALVSIETLEKVKDLFKAQRE
jgi:hypothetical protein